MPREHYHFVTGRLAEAALRQALASLAAEAGFEYSVQVLPISVAALMTPRWIAPRLSPPAEATRIMLPGYCLGELDPILDRCRVPVERGPRDLRRLAEHFGRPSTENVLDEYRIEILAEINHAPLLSRQEILVEARRMADHGADLIDLGCAPGSRWLQVGDCVRALRDEGLRVSIDSFDDDEIADAVRAGAELVLSVDARNRQAARDWGCEVVAIPDEPSDLNSLETTAEYLKGHGVRFRLDPILEPIGCGFSASLGRFLEVRRRFSNVEMMMGVGNLTELSDCDSAGVNFLLIGFCAEQKIHSVLTTQVINWARTSVKEIDLARRLIHYAVSRGSPPKNLDESLIVLRDASLKPFGGEALDQLAAALTDPNYRLFAEDGQMHVISTGLHLANQDPFQLFDDLLQSGPNQAAPRRLNASHAFYLGYELCKAMISLQLGKEYRQDESLNWGWLTEPENWHRLPRRVASDEEGSTGPPSLKPPSDSIRSVDDAEES